VVQQARQQVQKGERQRGHDDTEEALCFPKSRLGAATARDLLLEGDNEHADAVLQALRETCEPKEASDMQLARL
jgi:hypothetical protein